MRLAVIPARGGSKRIPRKNIKPFCGKPIIAWSIEAAIVSGCFDRIVVSTDDEEIASVARQHGAEVPFMRPPALAHDHAGTIPVIAHAIDWAGWNGNPPSHACCIYPAAPLLGADDLRRALGLLLENDCDYVFPVTGYASPIQRAMKMTPDGRLQMFDPGQFNKRSQELEPAFHDAGQFYWGRAGAWLAQRPIFSPTAIPVVLPRHRVADIDTPEDWMRAEIAFRVLQELENPS